MITHSPGPWTIRPVADLDFGETKPQDACIITANGLCAGVVWQDRDGVSADAALIAAAPDLLAALKAMIDHFGVLEDNPIMNETAVAASKAARAAINKAEGRV